ncbi:MAG: peptide-binding protein [bacterium]
MSSKLASCIALAPILAALCLTASCGGVVTRDPSILVTTLPADPPALNPITAMDSTSAEVDGYIFESLLKLDNKTLERKSQLAEGYEVSPDHLVYTFRLRDGVRWHDGKPFSADDVIYTFERIRDPAVDAANLRNYFKDVKSIEKLDERTVRFVYARPYFKALEIIGGALIIPKHIFADGSDFNSHPANRRPIGTGPYRFVQWKTGRNIGLARNDDYWGERPVISGIEYRIVPDAMVRFQLLKKAAIDMDSMRAIQWARQTEGASFVNNFTKHKYYLPNYSYIGWNMRGPFFDDRRVRKAMTMLVNRDAILKEILLGEGEVVASAFYRFGDQYDKSLSPLPYDPSEARRLLAEAGWSDTDGDGVLNKDGVPFRFALLVVAGSPLTRSIGLMMHEDLAKAGIEMEIRQLEWATLLKLLQERRFDAAIMAWSMPLEQDPYQVWHSSQAKDGSNFVGFTNARADKLLEEARGEFDKKARNDLYKEFQRIIYEEQPYTFLYSLPSLVAVAKRFENVVDYRVGLDMLEWNVGPWPTLIEW